MGTPFDVIIDLALTSIKDSALLALYNKSEARFLKQCDSWLISAIPNFSRCRQDLTYNIETREFDVELTNLEISILADLWALEWWKTQRNNNLAINNALVTSGSFKLSHSPATNLKEKTATMNGIREQVEQKMTAYQLQDIDNISI